MRIILMIALVSALAAGPGLAGTHTYGWEDGGTVLGFFGTNADNSDIMFVTPVASPDPVHSGSWSLRIEDNMASGTPQAYIAFIWGLLPNDTVTASFWRYDTTPAASPSCRIWGHWNDSLPGDYFFYDGSASGQSDYGLGTGWEQATYDYVNTDGHTGLVIECRTYTNPGDIVFIDDLEIVIPAQASFLLPSADFVSVEHTSFGSVKALFR